MEKGSSEVQGAQGLGFFFVFVLIIRMIICRLKHISRTARYCITLLMEI